jgi:hypothetical protein
MEQGNMPQARAEQSVAACRACNQFLTLESALKNAETFNPEPKKAVALRCPSTFSTSGRASLARKDE